MNEHIIVIGANGMLGHVVAKYLKTKYDVTALTSDDFNILYDKMDKFGQYVKDETTVVINCAGVIKPRIQFYDVQDVFKINSWFPIQLASYLNKDGTIDMIHISTDCVFTGNEGKYHEGSIPNAEDLYGMSKALGEACSKQAMVIRTSIIGEELKNKYSLLEWAKANAGQKVSGWTNHIWSGVTTLELAKFIDYTIENNSFTNEIVHYASKPINKYELLKLINKVYKLNMDIEKVDSGVDCDRSLVTYSEDYDAPDLELQLKELKEFFENGNV